jgi:hypothetical protein
MYYIETAADVRKAVTALEDRIAEAGRTQSDVNGTSRSNAHGDATVQ